jgi:hypothetical protein
LKLNNKIEKQNPTKLISYENKILQQHSYNYEEQKKCKNQIKNKYNAKTKNKKEEEKILP